MVLNASKLMIKRLKELLYAGKSFSFETTAAGTNYIKHLKLAKNEGYQVNLTFLWLSKPEEAVKRVVQRVKQGGHHVPEDSIVRRYYAGIKNLVFHYLPLADEALVIDNSIEAKVSKKVIVRKDRNRPIEIVDKDIWRRMERIANER